MARLGMRLFIAIDLPVIHRPWVAARQEQVRNAWLGSQKGLRWSLPEQWHLTLKFLGECPEDRIPGIIAVMKDAAAGVQPFRMSLSDLGSFSGPRMGVLWIGVATGADHLSEIATRVAILSSEKEKRLFRGHVTLARSRGKIPGKTIRELPPATEPCPETFVDGFHLYRSDLAATGSTYTRLHSVLFR